MKDRVSANPGRVKLTPEDGSPAFYATMERADNPIEEGTPLNKSTLLSDAACDLLKIPQTSTVNEAFLKLALGVGKYGYTVHFQWPDGSPMVGYRVSGLTAIDGSALTTDDTGTVFGVSENTSVSVSVSTSFQDLNTASKTIRSTGILTEDTVKITSKSSFTLTANSSQSYQFSQWAPLVDICAVGGGGSGGAAGFAGLSYLSVGAACGGAGGDVNVLENYNPAGKTLTVSIGAGGEGVKHNGINSPAKGNSGGTTTVKSGTATVLSASGGNGGNADSEYAYRNTNKSVSARASGASGGSGSGGCCASASTYSSTTHWASGAGASGSNGEDGEAGIAEDDEGGTHGSVGGGKGQGTTTAFNGTTYSAAGGGAAYAFYDINNEHESETAAGGSGAGAGHVGANGGNATQKGAGGGGAVSSDNNDNVTSGAGADGRVIIKKAS